ncbi:hypothetical protein ACP3T3_16385 [Chryseobacterium sp. CBSDS_008]|uniref:hypothetical protein n=1 Tax=Chryseobacterium sp. CBSDS_008 TaxID=3415265 RepID=UPI003CFA2A41
MQTDTLSNREKLLYSNRQYFESCIQIAQKLFEEKLYEDCINYIEKIASFGWFNFSGYYKSKPLEILLYNIQQKILSPSLQHRQQSKSNKILHICSEVYTSGGHSKLLYNWIKNDPAKKHTILSTRLSLEELLEVSNFYLQNKNDVKHISVLSSSKIESVKLLNQQALNEYDAILLHIHPDEAVAHIVLSQKDITTPVCLINHADHVFWLGTSIADMVLQIRESSISFDVERRGIPLERQFFLPIPVENSCDVHEKKDTETKNIKLLSTGTSYKYNPNEQYNFLREAYRIVEENPEVIFNIVGISPDSVYAKEYQHDRIVLHGIVSTSELSDIESITDIYVEGFPLPSFTALLQPALCKIPFVLHYNPLPLFKLFSENKDHGTLYPKNAEEWHNNIKRMIRDKKYREETAQKQYEYVLSNFSIEVWKSSIEKLYNIISQKNHSFWKSSPDKFYDSENEKILVTIDKKRFMHYSFTEKLSLRGKYMVYQMSKIRNANIIYIRKRELIKYFTQRQ